jgi:CheY-like chemotaxis protein
MASPTQILIVEDEPLIAMMLEDFLEVLDKTSAGTVDTVAGAAILDVNLRGGEKSTPIAEALAARDIPFIFATGGSDDSVDAQFRDRPVLQKPFTMDGVAKALDAL